LELIIVFFFANIFSIAMINSKNDENHCYIKIFIFNLKDHNHITQNSILVSYKYKQVLHFHSFVKPFE